MQRQIFFGIFLEFFAKNSLPSHKSAYNSIMPQAIPQGSFKKANQDGTSNAPQQIR